MSQKLNHIANFGALGGVQSYLIGLKKFSSQNISLFSTKRAIDIYSSTINDDKIHHLNYDASKLSSGLYFYGLESETSRLIKRFNVVR